MTYRLQLSPSSIDKLNIVRELKGKPAYYRTPVELIMPGDEIEGFYYKTTTEEVPVKAIVTDRKEVFEVGIRCLSPKCVLSEDTALVYIDKSKRPLKKLYYSGFGEGQVDAMIRDFSMKDGFITRRFNYHLNKTAIPYNFLQFDFDIDVDDKRFVVYQNHDFPIPLVPQKL